MNPFNPSNSTPFHWKEWFKNRSITAQFIWINIAVWFLIQLSNVVFFLFNIEHLDKLSYLSLPAYLPHLIYKPWTLFTYMFVHESFWHILFNLLVFYWFSKILTQFLQDKHIITLYMLGGLMGGTLYIAAYNIFPVFQAHLEGATLIGASAAAMAIVIASAVYLPNYAINLLFFGQIPLKYIALVYVVMDLLSIASDNAGGHLSHLGGALAGYIFIIQYKKGKDLSFIVTYLTTLFTPKPKLKVNKNPRPMSDDTYNKQRAAQQVVIDKILDKISKSGYNTLTKEEKELLFKSSHS